MVRAGMRGREDKPVILMLNAGRAVIALSSRCGRWARAQVLTSATFSAAGPVEVPGEDHISLPMRLDRLAPTVIDWLDNASPRRFCPPPLALAAAALADAA